MYCRQCGNYMIDTEDVCNRCKYDMSNEIPKDLEFIYTKCEKILQEALDMVLNAYIRFKVTDDIMDTIKPYLTTEHRVVGQETHTYKEFSMKAVKRAGFTYQKGVGYIKGYLIMPDRQDMMERIFNCVDECTYTRDVYDDVLVVNIDSLKSKKELKNFLFITYPKLNQLIEDMKQQLKEYDKQKEKELKEFLNKQTNKNTESNSKINVNQEVPKKSQKVTSLNQFI